MKERTKKLFLFAAVLLGVAFLKLIVQYQIGKATISNPIVANTDAGSNRELLWVYNADNVAHEDGDVVVWNDGSSDDGLQISTTATANNGLVAGVCFGDISATSWGWLQVSGYHDSVTIAVANSAGDALVTSTTGEGSTVYTVAMATGTAANQSNIDGVFAVAFEATTTSTTVKALILRE